MKKRTQMNIMVKHFADVYYVKGNSLPQLDVKPSDLYPMSENHVFRKQEFIHTRMEPNAIGEYEAVHYGKFLVMRNDSEQIDTAIDTRPLDVLDFGVQVNFVPEKDGSTLSTIFGESSFVYKRALRSASQFRTAKMLMTEEALVGAVRTHASYGWIDRLEGKTFTTVAKVEPYIGLALSSTVSAGTGYTDVNIADFVANVDITGSLTMTKSKGENAIVRYDELMGRTKDEMELTDGQSLISPKALAKASLEAGIISRKQSRLLNGAFKQGMTLTQQLADSTLTKVWAKIPSAIQFRYGLKKGLAIMIDHNFVDAEGNQFDLVFPDGANKGEVKRFENVYKNGVLTTIDHSEGASNEEVELAIAGISSLKERKWATMNYQFIQSLDLDFKTDIVPLAKAYIAKIVKALDSPESAMAFIGMIDSGDEEEYAERNALQSIRKLLEANPRIFYTKWLQMKIKKLMMKSINDMKKGRIGIENSSFVYIVADPAVLMTGAPLLKEGQAYYNGQVGMRSIFRSPLIHKSEPVQIELVTSPELEEAYGHSKNVLILNVMDDTLPRMGGADCDGDKVFMVNNDIITNAVETGLPMIYGDIDSVKLTPFVWENGGTKQIKEYDKNTLAPSQIGTITNYCTAIADTARDIRTTEEGSESNWNLVTLGRILQGKVIDDAKRGTSTEIDERLKVKSYPTWLGAGKVRHESYSTMGRLDRWVREVVVPGFEERFGEMKDYRENILMDYTNYCPLTLNEVIPQVQQLEASYRQDIKNFFETVGKEPLKQDFLTTEEYRQEMDKRSAMFEVIISRHQLLLSTIDASASTIGLAAIHVAENIIRSGASKTASYPFVVATEYTMALLSGLPTNFKLSRVKTDDILEAGIIVELVDGTLISDGYEVGTVRNVENGNYEVYAFNDSYYIKVETAVEQVQVERTEEEIVQFELKGFKNHNGLTSEDVIKLIDSRTISLQKVVNDKGNWLGVMFAGAQIGAVGKETFLNVNFAQGQSLQVLDLQPIKGIVKVTARLLQGQVEQLVEVQEEPLQVTDMYYQPEYEMYDMSIGMFQ